MPGLERYKNVLVLAAHPDDETLGCGGTIAKLSSLGSSVRLLTFTDGIGSREPGQRTSQLSQVSNSLGIFEYKSFNFPDNKMDSVPLLDVVKKIESYVSDRAFKPDLVLTHSPFCLNIDHRIVYNATITAFRGLNIFSPIKIMSYEVPSSSEWMPMSRFVPNCYVDIKHQLEDKINALSFYKDEMRDHPHPRSFENVKRLAAVHGSECGLELAERFMIIREVVK